MPDVTEALTQSLCPVCLRLVDAAYVREGSTVFLQKTCPQHGTFRVPAWVEAAGAPTFGTWRQGARIPAYPAHPATAVAQGCPYDCGLCPEHAQHTCTGLIEVTQRCSLRCPVCYARAADGGRAHAEDPSLSVIAAQLDALFAASGACNVQLSGGEPTERDDLPDIIRMAKARGFGLVQVNSNGLRLGTEAGYAERLKAAGLDSVYLQFDGVDDSAFRVLRGRDCLAFKQAALDACAAAGLGVVLVCTLARGVNDGMVGALLRWAVGQGRYVRGLHFQPVSSFGRFPWELDAAPRVTLPELMTALETQSGGMVRAAHFHAPSCEHPLCSFSAVYARAEGGLSAEPLGAACCSGGTGLAAPQKMDNAEGARKSKAFVAHHWNSPSAQADAEHAANVLPAHHAAQGTASGMESIRKAEAGQPAGMKKSFAALDDDFSRFLARSGADNRFTLSAMAFQDALSLDIARVRGCCIHVVTQEGKLIPFCLYNLTSRDGDALYREREQRLAGAQVR